MEDKLEELVSNLNSSMVDPDRRPQDLLDTLEEMGVIFEGEGWSYNPV